jgi:hypothetical protein
MARQRIAPTMTAEDLRRSLEGELRFIWRHNGGADQGAMRTRAVAVIELLGRHLKELGIERSLIRPLADLNRAFAESNRGRLDPLFQPVLLKHRQPTSLGQLWAMALASVAIDLLMAGKLRKENAAREVAKALRKFNFPIENKRGVPDWKTVIGWREALRKAKGHPDVLWYGHFYRLQREAGLSLVRAQNLDPKALAKQVLERLRRSLTVLGEKPPS